MVFQTEPSVKDDSADDQKWRRLIEVLVSAIESGELASLLDNSKEDAHEDKQKDWNRLV